MNAYNILSQGAFWRINKNVTKIIGDARGSLLLSYLLDKRQYHIDRNELIESEGEAWFYATTETVENDLCLTYRQQKTLTDKLIASGAVMTKVMGMPAKTHYCLDDAKICEMVNTSFDKNAILDFTKAQNNIKNKVSKNKMVGKVRKADLQTLIDAEPLTPEQLDTALPSSVLVKKEKSFGKKEKAVTPETARRRDAMIRTMQGQAPVATDEAKTAPAPLTIEQATAAIMAELETPEGQRKLKFAAGRGGIKTMPKNLFAAVARYVEHQSERGASVAPDPIYKLGGYLNEQARKEARQAETQTFYANKSKSNATQRFQPNDNPATYDYDNLPEWGSKPVSNPATRTD